MSESTLHLRDEATGLCAVCGANLRRPASRWWLLNCWTADPKHYRASQTCHPAETVRPCGVLASSKPPNAALMGGAGFDRSPKWRTAGLCGISGLCDQEGSMSLEEAAKMAHALLRVRSDTESRAVCEALRAALSEAEKRRKPCTCHDTSRGPGRPCAVKAGTKLGKLWQCVEEPRRESAQAKSAEASGDPAPANNLPDWDECALRVRNSNFIAKRVAEGGYGAESVSKLATQLHRFIYEYDDADPYRSAWFRHRLELVLQEARRELSDEVEAVIAYRYVARESPRGVRR